MSFKVLQMRKAEIDNNYSQMNQAIESVEYCSYNQETGVTTGCNKNGTSIFELHDEDNNGINEYYRLNYGLTNTYECWYDNETGNRTKSIYNGITYEYDSNGNVSSETYSIDGGIVRTDYNDNGYVYTLDDNSDGVADYISTYEKDENGNMTLANKEDARPFIKKVSDFFSNLF